MTRHVWMGVRPNPKKHRADRRNWQERMARRGSAVVAPAVIATSGKLGPAATSARFASFFARCQDEIKQTQRRFTTATMRPLCSVVYEDGRTRQATDAEIAVEGAFTEAKHVALGVGYRAMHAHAKRLAKQYGLKDKYVPQ